VSTTVTLSPDLWAAVAIASELVVLPTPPLMLVTPMIILPPGIFKYLFLFIYLL
jgi:hypothetical protein